MMKRRSTYSSILMMVVFAIAGCSSAPTQEQQFALERSKNSVASLDQQFQTARHEMVPVLAPSSFEKADAALTQAKDSIQNNNPADADKSVGEATAFLATARQFADAAKQNVPDAIKARVSAVGAGAGSHLESFVKADEEFRALVDSIEQGNVDWAVTVEKKVIDLFHVAETKATKMDALATAKDYMERAITGDAESLAPLTLEQTKKAIQKAELFIEKKPRERQQIQVLAQTAVFEAKRLLHITLASRTFSDVSSEAMVLWMEKNIHSINQHLGGKDYRDRTLDDQITKLYGSINRLQAGKEQAISESNQLSNKMANLSSYAERLKELNQQKSAQLATTSAQLATLEQETQAKEEKLDSLEKKQAWNQKFDQVVAMFDPKEAEVYKQGKKLLIRLKSLEFPVGKATLGSENFPLLTKVKEAIEVFEAPRVLIEGHTDATGSEKLNVSLSENRAKAILDYLVANKIIPSDRTESVGHGSSRPVATNETAKGRAQNRRVDIIIEPNEEELMGQWQQETKSDGISS